MPPSPPEQRYSAEDVERAARAIHDKRCEFPWEAMTDAHWEAHYTETRAVLDSLPERAGSLPAETEGWPFDDATGLPKAKRAEAEADRLREEHERLLQLVRDVLPRVGWFGLDDDQHAALKELTALSSEKESESRFGPDGKERE